jgi:alkylation response protein AidB-like acyl-CoA dehydrogenase
VDFEFTEDQNSLRGAVRRWVERGFPFERRHAVSRAGGGTRAVYAELARLGMSGLIVPEANGGLGLGGIEALAVCEELGRGLVNAPFAYGALMTPVLLSAAPPTLRSAWLPRIATAEALVVPALQEQTARYRWWHVETQGQRVGNAWRLSGTKCAVPAADEADAFLVPARISGNVDDDAGIALFLVGKSDVRIIAYPTQDGARAGDVHLQSAPATLVAENAFGAIETAFDVGIAALCAEAVGLMDRLLELTVEYMNTRKQFGATLSSFQSLRHRVADIKMALELGRSMSYLASLRLEDPVTRRRLAVAQARVQIGQSMRFVGQQCIQLHGGIGCTDEYIASHYFKRLTMIELTLGDTLHHLGEVAARMQDTAGVFA